MFLLVSLLTLGPFVMAVCCSSDSVSQTLDAVCMGEGSVYL